MIKEIKRVRLQTLARILCSQKITLTFSKGAYTDLKTITLLPFEGEIEPGIPASRAECWLALKATTAHEAGHILYTDRGALEKAQHNKLLALLLNIVEDSRIELAMSNTYPGTAGWFRFVSDYIYKNRKNWGTGINALLGGLAIYATAGRVPEQVASQDKVMKLIEECAPLIDLGRIEEDSYGALIRAEEIYKILKSYMEKEIESLEGTPEVRGTYKPSKAPGKKTDPRREPVIKKSKKESHSTPDSEDEPAHSTTTEATEDVESEVKETGTPEAKEEKTKEPEEETKESPETEETIEPGHEKDTPDEDKNTAEDTETSEEEVEAEESADEIEFLEAEEESEKSEGIPKDKPGEPEDPKTEETEESPETEETIEPGDELKADIPEITEEDKETADKSGHKKDTPDEDKNTVEDAETSKEEAEEPADEIEFPEAEASEDPKIPVEPEEESMDDIEIDPEILEEAEKELDELETRAMREEKEDDTVPEITPGEIEELLSKGIHRGIYLEKKPCAPDRGKYMELYNAVRPHIKRTTNEIRKILEYRRSFTERNLRKGRLDSGNLWKLQARDPKVFLRKNDPGDIPTLAVYLLVDCSGSMNFGKGKESIQHAREAACLLTETCMSLKIPVQVTGFTGDLEEDSRDVTHLEAKKFDEDKKEKIAGLKALAENRDGYSIRIAAKELEQRREDKKVLITLSDGLPAMPHNNYIDKRGVKDTAKAVREAEKKGIGVIGLFFGHKMHLPQAQMIYNHCIYVQQIDTLPLQLARVLKKVVKTL